MLTKTIGNNLTNFHFYFAQVFKSKFSEFSVKLIESIDILKSSINVFPSHGVLKWIFITTNKGKIADVN